MSAPDRLQTLTSRRNLNNMRALDAMLLTVALALPTTARADYIAPCSPPSNMKQVAFNDLPTDMADALRGNAGAFVGPSEEFDSTDVAFTHVNRRVIFIWRDADDWIIATEHGGLGYNDPVFSFKRAATVTLTSTTIAFPATVCSVATTLARSFGP